MMERVSDEWLNNAIQRYRIIDSKSKGANMYHLALCELRERRQMEDEKGELVVASMFMAIKTAEILQLLKKAEKEQGHTDNSASEKDGAEATQECERAILALPVKQVDGVSVETWTVKQWFQKINEELDELKAEVLNDFYSLELVPPDRLDLQNAGHGRMPKLAEEAADTITAITSMLEAMGIDEQQRQAAQRRVNKHNRQRGRC